jgi:hypothetical protein
MYSFYDHLITSQEGPNAIQFEFNLDSLIPRNNMPEASVDSGEEAADISGSLNEQPYSDSEGQFDDASKHGKLQKKDDAPAKKKLKTRFAHFYFILQHYLS